MSVPRKQQASPHSRAHLPCQGIRHGEVKSHFEIKGVNCLDTTILKSSLWSCPHRRNNCRLIKEDQRWTSRQEGAASGPCRTGALCLSVVLLHCSPFSPGDAPRHGVLSLRTSFPPPPHPKTGCWPPAKPQRKSNKTYRKDKRASLAIGQITAIRCTCRAWTELYR